MDDSDDLPIELLKEMVLQHIGRCRGDQFSINGNHPYLFAKQITIHVHMGSGEYAMGDIFKNKQSPTMSQGRNNIVSNPDSNTAYNDVNKVDEKYLVMLADELRILKLHLREMSEDHEHFVVLSSIATAEKAAFSNDSNGVAQALKKAGVWALEAAKEIGASVAAEALKKSMGL